jgi:hypothetical protein
MEFQYRLQRMEMPEAQLFDPVRKRWVKETPEELVRQCLILWLQISLSIPYGRMGVEKQIQVLGLTKRFDLLIYNKQALPLILIECKSPQISLNQAMFDQAAIYNLKLKAPYLSICNGLDLRICKIDFDKMNYQFVDHFPVYPF